MHRVGSPATGNAPGTGIGGDCFTIYAPHEGRAIGLDYTRLGYNLRAATDVFPALAGGRVVRCWSGIEGISPDALPIIGPSASEDGIWHSFAYSTHGFYLGPAAGRVLAEAMTGERPAVSLEPFHIGRFSSPDIGSA